MKSWGQVHSQPPHLVTGGWELWGEPIAATGWGQRSLLCPVGPSVHAALGEGGTAQPSGGRAWCSREGCRGEEPLAQNGQRGGPAARAFWRMVGGEPCQHRLPVEKRARRRWEFIPGLETSWARNEGLGPRWCFSSCVPAGGGGPGRGGSTWEPSSGSADAVEEPGFGCLDRGSSGFRAGT